MPAPHDIVRKQIWEKIEEARTPQQKVNVIKDEISRLPRFSTFMKIKQDLDKEIKRLETHRKKAECHPTLNIRKQGIGQIVLIGFPNAGKSTIMSRITDADPKIAAYAFTTKKPYSGMMKIRGGQIQLIEIPGIMEGAADGFGRGKEFLAVARNADAVCLLAALDDKPQEKYQLLMNELKKSAINKPTIILATKSDAADLELQTELKVYKVNQNQNLNFLGEIFFRLLGKIRVYTKKPRESADINDAIVLDKESTVQNLLDHLPSVPKTVKSANVWGSTKFPGQEVSLDYKLKEGDIVQFK